MFAQGLSIARNGRGHKWGKAEAMARLRISRLTEPGDIVFDPFCGGGSIAAACKILGRRYLAFEIESVTAIDARRRIVNTQPPLFIPQEQQLELFVFEQSWN